MSFTLSLASLCYDWPHLEDCDRLTFFVCFGRAVQEDFQIKNWEGMNDYFNVKNFALNDSDALKFH